MENKIKAEIEKSKKIIDKYIDKKERDLISPYDNKCWDLEIKRKIALEECLIWAEDLRVNFREKIKKRVEQGCKKPISLRNPDGWLCGDRIGTPETFYFCEECKTKLKRELEEMDKQFNGGGDGF